MRRRTGSPKPCRRMFPISRCVREVTSVDISNRGVDKAYAVRKLADMLGVTVGQIAFVGDRMDPDGNDYPAALAGTIAIRVTGPEDTLQLCNRIIDWYNRNSR